MADGIIPGLLEDDQRRVPQTAEEWMDLDFYVADIFSPHAPIDADELFSGRKELLLRILDVIQ